MDAIGRIAHFIDPLSLAIVFGGALAGRGRCARPAATSSRAFAALGPLLRADPEADADAAVRAVNAIEALAQVRGIACVDRVDTAGRFLKRAAFKLSDAASADAFADWARDELDGAPPPPRCRRRLLARRRRCRPGDGHDRHDHRPDRDVLGDGRLPRAIGPAMALAMLTTLYGVILSGAIAGPIAARLERLSEAERAWQARALERLERLARAELAAGRAPAPARPALRTVA